MSRRPIYDRGHYYHFYNRGAHRLSIFREPDNYYQVIRKLRQYSHALNLAVIAYCLLPNHYHFLVRQDGEARAGLLPQRIFNSYSKAYNQRYGHSGTLFEGAYRVKPVESEAYLYAVCRYIHANPVLHGIVDDLREWPYSNYLEWLGERDGMLIDRDLIACYVESPAAYEVDVDAYLRDKQALRELDYLMEWEVL